MTDPNDPAHLETALAARQVPERVLPTVLRMVACIKAAADDVATDTADDRFDDSNGRGFLRYRRARNRMIEEFDGDGAVVAESANNALSVNTDGVAISFYSAPNGVEEPAIVGSTWTQRRLLSDMQLQLDLDDIWVAPKRLVLIHECDEDGLSRAALGVVTSRSMWAWHEVVYDRRVTVQLGETQAAPVPNYDEQPESELPPIELRDDVASPAIEAEQPQ